MYMQCHCASSNVMSIFQLYKLFDRYVEPLLCDVELLVRSVK